MARHEGQIGTSRRCGVGLIVLIGQCCGAFACEHSLLGAEERRVRTRQELQRALSEARPGTTILIEPGEYAGGFFVDTLQGTREQPILIAARDPRRPPIIRGGNNAFQISRAKHLELRDLHLTGATQNGLNLDDGGSAQTPAEHILLRNLRITDVGPEGNRDGIKLSGLVHFRIENCVVERWGSGGSAIDMVGCAEGVIEGCQFREARGPQPNGVQAKGGSRKIVVRRCLFEQTGDRSVNIGGSTGLPYFRPQPQGYEAQEIVVEDCEFRGGGAAVAFVGVDQAIVRHNLILRPERWVARILQETTGPDFIPCRNGQFVNNVVLFRADTLRATINVGPNTAPETFQFARNLWYCEDRPAETRRLVRLPVAETQGVYDLNPWDTTQPRDSPRLRTNLPHQAGIRPENQRQ